MEQARSVHGACTEHHRSCTKSNQPAGGFSYLVAAKLVTTLSLEAFSLNGFNHDGVCTELARTIKGACTEGSQREHGACTECERACTDRAGGIHGACRGRAWSVHRACIEHAHNTFTRQ